MIDFLNFNEKDIDGFLKQANETSLILFKQGDDFINEYIATNELSYKNKLKDIEIMIEYFVKEERYEDCALLVEIKNKIKKYYDKQTELLLKNIK